MAAPVLDLQEFECVEAGPGRALLRVAARPHEGVKPNGPPTLVIDDGSEVHRLSRAVRSICTAVLEASNAIDQGILDQFRGYQFGITALFILLCEALLLRGQSDAVPEMIEQGLSKCSLNTERFFEAELYRLKARVVLLGREPNASSHAQSLLERALTIARSQSARSLELRAARDLADLWRGQGRLGEARDLLAPIHSWFIEGLDTPDLKESKALLEGLCVVG